jgi:hypothetical protein
MSENRGTAYMVIHCDDIASYAGQVGGWQIELVPARRAVEWRGRRFNLRTARASGRILPAPSAPTEGPHEYVRSYSIDMSA